MRCAPGVCLVALLASGCGGISSPSANTVQDFPPTVWEVDHINVHQFDTTRSGEYSALLTALAPSAVLGLALGQVSGDTCVPTPGLSGAAQVGQIALNGAIQRGHYCIEVYDFLGTLTVAQTYTLRVSHP